ncbi:hypothetical protein ACLOJK_008021 [Asimina triloba]
MRRYGRGAGRGEGERERRERRGEGREEFKQDLLRPMVLESEKRAERAPDSKVVVARRKTKEEDDSACGHQGENGETSAGEEGRMWETEECAISDASEH